MSTNGLIGRAVKRVEDKRFTTGHGNYTDDIVLPQQTYAAFVRSQYAHARIGNIDISAAKEMPGVIAIFTGADLAAVNGVPCGWQVNFKNGDTMKEPKHPLLVADKARHAGDAIAVVDVSAIMLPLKEQRRCATGGHDERDIGPSDYVPIRWLRQDHWREGDR